MDKNDLTEKIARLEFQNDQLITELEYVDSLLRNAGFSEGLSSLKSAARELVDYEKLERSRFEDGLPDEPPGLE
jgi:hypothetical protein